MQIGWEAGRVLVRPIVMRVKAMLVGLVVLVAGCGSGPVSVTSPPATVPSPTSVTTIADRPVPEGSVLAEFEAAREKWAAADLPTYRYVFEDDCGECEPSGEQVVVWDGDVAAGTEQPSVGAVFDAIETAIDSGQTVAVAYDETLGYPIEVWIDREARVRDGGTHWLIQDLVAGLPGAPASIEELDRAEATWRAHRPGAYEFRTAILCDCALEGWLWTHVEGDHIVDWEVDLADDASASLSPITIDEMLADLRDLLSSGVEEDGVRITGAAEYDSAMGYPMWIGLDVEVVDPTGELGYLPPRLVFNVTDFRVVAPSLESEFGISGIDTAAARERWEAAGLVDYQYELTVHDIVNADFGDPYVVNVEGGEVVAITQGGEPVEEGDVPAHTIDSLFDLIQLWMASGTEVEAVYNEPLGYPVIVVRRSEESPLVLSIGQMNAG